MSKSELDVETKSLEEVVRTLNVGDVNEDLDLHPSEDIALETDPSSLYRSAAKISADLGLEQ